ISNLIPRLSTCGVDVDATHIYWGDPYNETIGRMELSNTRTGDADILSERLGIDQALISGVEGACGVAVEGGRVYWTSSDGTIGRANVDGSGIQRDFISGLVDPCGVDVDATHVYWGDAVADAIGRARIDGSEVEAEFIADAEDSCDIAVNGSHLYWSSFDYAIGRADLDGDNPDPGFLPLPGYPCGIAVDPAHLYWTYPMKPGGAQVGSANLDGSAAAPLVVDPDYGADCGIAVDSRVFHPASLPASLPLRFGKVKRQRGGKLLTMEVVVAEGGELEVVSPALGWSLDKGPAPAPGVAGAFRWKLSLWPGKGRVGKRIRKQLREKGKAPVTLRFAWTQDRHETLDQLKRLAFTR
ncbi:MAG TPA: hypothetical protein VFB52_03790, partial [Solirubrobacterales bacterium]|nr:hypothetical protein [Solirubrobacterales bacterium]